MIALCIGHSRLVNGRSEGGAISVGGESEHSYWSAVAPLIADALLPLDSCIITRYESASYGSAMRWLARRLREINAKGAVELHFNSTTNERAEGHEWLYWHSSTKGRALAAALDASYGAAFPTLKSRGLKAITTGGRGAGFLRGTHCPAAIAEGFFGSSHSDFSFAHANRARIAAAIAAGIRAWVG